MTPGLGLKLVPPRGDFSAYYTADRSRAGVTQSWKHHNMDIMWLAEIPAQAEHRYLDRLDL